VATYGTRSLPGRLLVNKGHQHGTSFVAATFDLTNAKRLALPLSTTPSADRWTASAALAARSRGAGSALAVDLFRAGDLSLLRTVTLPGESSIPRPSPDGRYLLAFVGDALTVFDAADGRQVETVSQTSGYSILGDPAAWLPDGSYAFLVGRTLYRTRPGADTVTTVAALALPGPTPSAVLHSDLAASPDGQRLAISWRDLDSGDADLWTVRVDGTDLRRLTQQPASTPALDYTHASPAWSPDSKWVAAVLYMSGTSSSPLFPDEPFLGGRITGTTGCIDQIFVVAADGPTVELTWPRWDREHGIKVRDPSDMGGQWLSTCGAEVGWVP
jgi:Tol biopolymer transport system component